MRTLDISRSWVWQVLCYNVCKGTSQINMVMFPLATYFMSFCDKYKIFHVLCQALLTGKCCSGHCWEEQTRVNDACWEKEADFSVSWQLIHAHIELFCLCWVRACGWAVWPPSTPAPQWVSIALCSVTQCQAKQAAFPRSQWLSPEIHFPWWYHPTSFPDLEGLQFMSKNHTPDCVISLSVRGRINPWILGGKLAINGLDLSSTVKEHWILVICTKWEES